MQRVIKGHRIVVYDATSPCKNKGSMDPVHDKGVHGPGPYFDGPGPWTWSTEGVHGPGVHVLYFPHKTVFNYSQQILFTFSLITFQTSFSSGLPCSSSAIAFWTSSRIFSLVLGLISLIFGPTKTVQTCFRQLRCNHYQSLTVSKTNRNQ